MPYHKAKKRIFRCAKLKIFPSGGFPYKISTRHLVPRDTCFSWLWAKRAEKAEPTITVVINFPKLYAECAWMICLTKPNPSHIVWDSHASQHILLQSDERRVPAPIAHTIFKPTRGYRRRRHPLRSRRELRGWARKIGTTDRKPVTKIGH